MNTTRIGNAFEEKSYGLITSAINENKFGVIPTCCKVFRKKGYYSKDRASNIVFDLTIEVWPEGAESYTLLYIVECKDYSNHKVPIDDLEEFESKVKQVAGLNVKGVLITSSTFSKTALNFAKSKGIMLIQVNAENQSKIMLYNTKREKNISQDYPVPAIANEIKKVVEINSFFDENKDEKPDLDIKLKNFLTSLIDGKLDSKLTDDVKVLGLERLSQKLIEDLTCKIITDFDPSIFKNFGSVPLERFGLYLKEKFSVETILDQSIPLNKGKKLLGIFDSKQKKIYIDQSIVGTDQFAFVYAHEIAHFFLHSYLQMDQLIYDGLSDSKYNSTIKRHELLNEKHWIEWQANQFAASFLMPEKCVIFRLIRYQIKEGIRNRGTIYLDNEKVNIYGFQVVTCWLAYIFGVSRTVIEYRLADLNTIIYAKGVNVNRAALFNSYKQPRTLGQILKQHSIFRESE